MTPSARVQCAIDLLDVIILSARDGGAAADVVATRFFKERRYAGSGDRRAVRDLAWRAIRQFGAVPADGRSALVTLARKDAGLAALFDGTGHGPAPIEPGAQGAGGQPIARWLFRQLDPRIDAAEAAALLTRAPLDLRINRSLGADVGLPAGQPLPAPLDGLRLPADSAIEATEAWRAGAIEVQDAGSQWVAQACAPVAGTTIVDLCAGGGGKTLALAAKLAMQAAAGTAATRLIACDTDRRRLGQLAPRSQRAGATGIELRLLDPGKEAAQLADLAGECALVLVDAPCSGSGTWRRHPDARWRLTPARLTRVVAQQSAILDTAARLVAPGGAMVYAVCSLVMAEGEGQVAAFLKRHAGWTVQPPLPAGIGRAAGAGQLLTPLHDGTDGFFVARLHRR